MHARLAACGIVCRFVEAQASDLVVKQRLKTHAARADEVSDAHLEDFQTLKGMYEPPLELAAGCCVKVRTTSQPEQTVTRTLQALARLRLVSSLRFMSTTNTLARSLSGAQLGAEPLDFVHQVKDEF